MAKKHEHDGKTYDENKRYRDRSGIVWSFTGEGEQMVPGYDSRRNSEAGLAWVAEFEGPLTEVR